MSDNPQEARPRASLHGKGWEILRGSPLPEGAASGPLADEPLYATPTTDTVPIDADSERPLESRMAAPELAKLHKSPRPAREKPQPTTSAAEAAPAADMAAPEAATPGAPSANEYEALPPIEASNPNPPVRAPGYMIHPAVESLTPRTPEDLDNLDSGTAGAADAGRISLAAVATSQPEPDVLPTSDVVVRAQDVRIDSAQLITPAARPSADDLFGQSRELAPDRALLARLVTDERLDALWDELHQAQDEVLQRVQGDRTLANSYQQELLEATALLLQNRANYDDVRSILYRVRADLAREDKVRRDIRRYKPQVLAYILLAFVLWLVLMTLEPLFRQFMAEVVGLEALGLIYHPTLFGMLGGIVNAYFTLNKHTIQQQDFDPNHISWYLMNPVIGLIMGLLMTLVFGTGIVSTIGIGVLDANQSQMLGQYPFLLWVLCFLAGYNQNVVLRLLNRAFSLLRTHPDDEDADDGRHASSPPSTSA